MVDNKLDSCRITIDCPFCGVTIVEAYDHSLIDDDLDDDEREEITCGDMGFTDGECEHLAFESDWCYAGSYIKGKWEPQLTKLVLAAECYEDDLADSIATAINIDNIDFQKLSKEVLPEYEVKVTTNYVEIFDGPSSGGPTYMHIFLKEKL